MLEVNIKLGEKLVGIRLPFIPNNINEFFWSQNGEKHVVRSRLGDRPAFSEVITEDGLTSVVYTSNASTLTYRRFEKFEKFALHKDLGPVRLLHSENSFPETNFSETYRRFAKVIVGIGSSMGTDTYFGLATEFVLLNNFYVDNTENVVKIKLLYQGEPRANTQVEVFERSTSGTVNITTTRTSNNGIAVIPIRSGYEYLFDAVKLRRAKPSLVQEGVVWETLWASLMIKIPR